MLLFLLELKVIDHLHLPFGKVHEFGFDLLIVRNLRWQTGKNLLGIQRKFESLGNLLSLSFTRKVERWWWWWSAVDRGYEWELAFTISPSEWVREWREVVNSIHQLLC